jgi:uncharacterized protein YdaT
MYDSISHPLADREIQAFKAMESVASNERQMWQDIADLVAPRKSQITSSKTHDIEGFSDEIYNTEAIHSNSTLASGQMDYMVSGRFFEWMDPRGPDAPQDAKDWYKKISERALETLQETNFYLEIHEFFKDRGGFGTCFVQAEEDEEDAMFFSTQAIGSFYVEENQKGLVDTVRRKVKMTARQVMQMFGPERLSPSMKKALLSKEESERMEKFDVIHTMRPRDPSEIEPGKIDAVNMPFASIYVCEKDKYVINESGYPEQPFSVSRFEKWGDSPYGWCPSHMILPTVRQVQNIDRDLDALGEVSAFPRVITPKGTVGKVRLEAGGVTVYDAGTNNGGKPEEWATGGRYDIGIDRVERKQAMIRREYFVDLFQMLTNMDETRREKTAFEVSQMLHEKLTRISPTFERIKMEVFKPLLRRVFGICYRRGLFPDPPASVLKNRGDWTYVIPQPKINFVSKLAMAIKSMENKTFMEWYTMIQPMIEIVGVEPLMKELNFTRLIRQSAENQGVTVEFFNTPEEKQAIEEMLAKQAQAEQAMAVAESGSKVMGNVAKMPPEMQKETQATLKEQIG